MKLIKHLPLALGIAIASGPLLAESVYRWVDKDGTVNFSSTPPVNTGAQEVGTIELAPGPTPEEQNAAEELARTTGAAADRMRDERLGTNEKKQDSVADAELALKEAKEQYAKAQVQTPDDWQTIAGGGGRYLKESYFDRLRSAQEAVQKAEEDFARARRDAR